MFALVLTGPPGAGKTSVLEALSDTLVADDVRHATIETEALTSAHPALGDDQWPVPVRTVCGLYRSFGYELFLVAATVETGDDLRRLLEAVRADQHAVVRLQAAPATLRRRIVEREPQGWDGLDQLLAAAARLHAAIASLDGIALALDTTARTRGQWRRVCATRSRKPFDSGPTDHTARFDSGPRCWRRCEVAGCAPGPPWRSVPPVGVRQAQTRRAGGALFSP